MSWLFGLNKGQPNQPDFSQLGLPSPPGDGGSDDKGGSKKDSQGQSSDAYRFDSAALERAAKAAKDLEKSRRFYTTNISLLRVLSDFARTSDARHLSRGHCF